MSNSYTPLYRKYRPDKFSDLVGQETIASTLSNAIETGRIAHAYLLSGPRGTGKTSTARIFAKALNCKEGPTVNPCGKCSNCLDMASGFSMDVIEIDAASNRKVEDARNLLEKVQFVAANGKFKIYIIDEVHMLTKEAFNTLLKTLEEPPANLVFILATTEPHKVLDTIISRCQRFDFRRIRSEDIAKRLKEIAKIEKISINNDALSLIARKSGGGLRDALALLDQSSILALEGKEITDKDVRLLIGSISEEELHKIVDIIANKDAQNLIPLLHEIMQSGNEPLQIIRELTSYFRNLLLSKTVSNIEQLGKLIDLPQVYCKSLKLQSEKFETIEIALIIEKLSAHEATMKNSHNQHLWIEVSLIGICYRDEINTIKNLELRVEKLEKALLNGNINPTPVQTFAREEKTVQVMPAKEKMVEATNPIIAHVKKEIEPEKTQPQAIKEEQTEVKQEIKQEVQQEVQQEAPSAKTSQTASWSAFLENIDSLPSRMMLQTLAKPVEISSERIVITFNVESFVKQAQERPKSQALEKAAEKLFGKAPQIIIRLALPDDEKKNIELIKNDIKPNISTTKETVQQVSSGALIEKHKTPPARTAEKKILEISDELDYITKTVLSITLSDHSKTVLELFDGKIIN
jgi:DNA polymerase-3 subunit gamma/tau